MDRDDQFSENTELYQPHLDEKSLEYMLYTYDCDKQGILINQVQTQDVTHHMIETFREVQVNKSCTSGLQFAGLGPGDMWVSCNDL